MSGDWVLGIVGGSGVYGWPGLEDPQWIAVNSTFGTPSDEILCGRIGKVQIRFLPRHGRGHRLPPHGIDARANIDALKRAGATDIVALCAVKSLVEDLQPGRFAIIDQFIDTTARRHESFFGEGLVAHIGFAVPTCPRLSTLAADGVRRAGGVVSEGATYVAIPGPAFSTVAESRLHARWGGHVVGMTALPEARLAREAELPYACLAMVSDYGAWRDDGHAGGVAAAAAQVRANAALAAKAVGELAAALPETRDPSPIDRALDGAIVTAPGSRDAAAIIRLDAVAGRVLGGR